MQLVGTRGQFVRDFMYDASGTVTSGGTAQLVLPEHANRTSLFIQNLSSANLLFEFGGARATATITSGAVTSIAVNNGGFGYTIPPKVKFYGGGNSVSNPSYLCPGLPGNTAPSTIASGVSILSAGAVSSVTITNSGSNYVKAPYVFLQSLEIDPYGAASPSATSGTLLVPNGGSLYFNGTAITTDAISVYGGTTGQAFTCKYMIGG